MSVLPGSIHAEDLQPGLVLELGSHPVTEAEIIDFASQWDPHYFHVDPERAKEESRYAGLIASGLHTLSIYQRLWVLGRNDEWNVIAGAGISDARHMFSYQQRNSPLRRTVTIDEVGGSALYLLSDLASGVTGEIHYVDSGYHIVSMPTLDELKQTDG